MSSGENIKRFDQVSLADRLLVGGKGASLGELTRAGVAVPPGFIICTSAFEQFLALVEKQDPVRFQVEALDDQHLDETTALSDRLRKRFLNTPFPEGLRAQIMAAHAELCGQQLNLPLAVRSSATSEDAEDASFAGLQDTYLWVQGAQATLGSIRACWASLYSAASISYRRKRRIPESTVAMAVVVQSMVDARTAGVMFTRSPLTGDRSVVTIEATWGLGSALVGGEVTPDRFVISKANCEVCLREIGDKHVQHLPAQGGGVKQQDTPQELRQKPSLNDRELAALTDLAVEVERHYGRAQDIEWAIDHSGQNYVLQSRPETVWSSRDQQPVAKAAERPFMHVMKIFGGRR
ncbi:MAG: PEP/pyruvate-binding domain-containing protein [Acidobacteria bacterium]|nr:PEP/pyruvate-binding domain-containing protein [Acidobacteriota bacterium]